VKVKQYYLSTEQAAEDVIHDTDMSVLEVEEIVGRFSKDHPKWGGKLRGQVWVYENKVQIRHHFLKSKVLWESKYV
jgi:hypothetical protein